jgi:hypothetical protein
VVVFFHPNDKGIRIMNNSTDLAAEPRVKPFGKGKDGKKPPGTKGVYAFLPMENYYRVQAEAALHQMDVQSFVGKLLTETFPPLNSSSSEVTEPRPLRLSRGGLTNPPGQGRKLVIGRGSADLNDPSH